jgi:predicted amidohydrolase
MKALVAVAQMTSTADKAKNLDCSEKIINRAKSMGAQMVSLPENFAFFGIGDDQVLAESEPLDGPSISQLKACAKKNQIWLSLGGFQEKIPGSRKIYNSHLVIDDQGALVAVYRKMHLFSVSLEGKSYDEAKSVLAGDEVVCFRSPFFIGGLAICYDLRFAYLFSALQAKNAEVILVPSAFTAATGKDHWEILVRARAIETQCYIMAAAQIGRHNDKRTTHGHAMIIDPWGTILAQCGKVSDLALAEIDLAYLRKLRKQMPVAKHRRVDEASKF